MKWFLTIWTFYLMVLAALPCSDASNQCEDTVPKFETAQSHDHKQDKDDHCSPFCTCTCCATSVVAIDFTLFQIKKPTDFTISQKVAIRNFSFLSNFFGNIWQPPKIVSNC